MRKEERPTKKKGLFLALFIMVVFVLYHIGKDDNVQNNSTNISEKVSTQSEQTQHIISKEKEQEKTLKSQTVKIGNVLHTEYFDVKVNKVTLREKIDVGNPLLDLKTEEGAKYLIMNVTFKNTDTESRMIFDGSVWINYNGKDYEFDKSETIMMPGWGLFLDQINPMISKTTNLVYKIPEEIKGPVYWQPGRTSSDKRIFLGNI